MTHRSVRLHAVIKKVDWPFSAADPNGTMAGIRKLPSVLVDRIAAGEVVERPASVVKELVENSIDAGATHVIVETQAGGMQSILIRDNGSGIPFDELPLAVERHATSKIESLDDLEHILSYGFRGEALAAISSVSYLEIRSTHAGADTGGLLRARGGTIEEHRIDAPTEGTGIHVQELFYTTPARRKFLKSERSEDTAIHKELLRLAFAAPELHLEYYRDGKPIFNLPSDNDLRSRIATVYGPDFAARLLYVEERRDALVLTGFIGDDRSYRSQADRQFTTVNRRPVDIRHLPFFVRKAYGELIPDGGKPIFFLNLEVDSTRLDVNVHPTKKEVRLTDEALLHGLIMAACQRALFPDTPLPFLRGKSDDESRYVTGSPSQTDRTAAFREQLREGASPAPLLYPVDELLSAGMAVREERAYPVRPPETTTKRSFVPIRHFGVIFGTYILAEGENEFYLIDQHTAHERINFEKKRRELEARRFQRQILLHPIALDYDAQEAEQILSQQERLLQAGFVLEELGPGQLVLREAPDFLEPGEEKELVEHAIERLSGGEDLVRVYDEYAAMKACKASVKKNDILSPEIISGILRQLGECEQPSRCPHGRPTVLRFTRAELDRLFLRTGFGKQIDASSE
ncbi:MAG: DNA mismatch repair endonuclease MutL [Leptonema illini]|uniref:DNA mismatch repair protein MutL n=1 Tax=Leptonema illini TaxID=183 RepID=A0A833H5B2_9LEPT|nr:MAG: DNA mismatch repair endonuclease MutL [Leptonema illini]